MAGIGVLMIGVGGTFRNGMDILDEMRKNKDANQDRK